jgi:HPt (histidine-containing phosphotransfer) domain-containing protein
MTDPEDSFPNFESTPPTPLKTVERLDPLVIKQLGDSTDEEFMQELMNDFFSEADRLLETLQAVLVTGNAPEFHRAAHTLKANSAIMGAHYLSAMCRELEELGRVGALTEATAEKLAAARAEYAEVKIMLARLRSTPPGDSEETQNS